MNPKLIIEPLCVLSNYLKVPEEHYAESIVQTMKATKPSIEETRKFGGMFIVIMKKRR